MDPRVAQAQEACAQGEVTRGLALYREAAAQAFHDFETQSAIGFQLGAVSRLREFAEPFLRRALAIRPDILVMLELSGVLRRLGNHKEALSLLSDLLEDPRAQFFSQIQYHAIECLNALGMAKAAEEVAAQAFEIAMTNARTADPARPSLLVTPARLMQSHIGETILRFDTLIKAQRLGLLPAFHPDIIFEAESLAANPVLIDYFAEQIEVRTAPPERMRELPALYANRHFNTDFWVMSRLGGVQLIPAWTHVNRLWRESGRPPLLSLRERHRADGREQLRRAGMDEGSWFATLHVRAPTSYGDRSWNPAYLRNADLATYLPAIRAITEQGGWVIRLGDPSMPPLPPMERVIDYARAPFRSAWMDLFLCAESRFTLGMASGISQLPVVFGVPLVLVNGFSLGPFPVGPDSLYIHKRVETTDGRALSIREMFSPPILNQIHPRFFEQRGLRVVDNTPDEILHAALEMMDRVEAAPASWARYEAAADYYGHGLPGRASHYFLEKHAALID